MPLGDIELSMGMSGDFESAVRVVEHFPPKTATLCTTGGNGQHQRASRLYYFWCPKLQQVGVFV